MRLTLLARGGCVRPRGIPVPAKDALWRARDITRGRLGPKPAVPADDALPPIGVGSLSCCAAGSSACCLSTCRAVRAVDDAFCAAHAAMPVGWRITVVPSASIAPAMAPRNSAKGSPPELLKIKASDLVGQIAQPSRSGETPPFGERLPPLFRRRTLKVRTRIPAAPAPHGSGHQSGECLGRDRLEQRWEPGHNRLWGAGARSRHTAASGINARRVFSWAPAS